MPPETRLLPTRLLLVWAGLLGLALVVTLGIGVQDADYPTPFALEHAYLMAVGAELFALLVVAPLVAGRRRVRLVALVVLLAMAAPLVLVAARVSDVEAASVAASQAYLLVAAIAVAGYLRVDAGGASRGVYWLVLGAAGAGAPLAAFLVGDAMRVPLTWLNAVSPFWVLTRLCEAWRFGWEWAAPAMGMVAVAAALQAWPGGRVTRDA